jgi:hypothetical protein
MGATESLVYRVLQTQEYRTKAIVLRFLEAAFAAPISSEELDRRAQNVLDRMQHYPETGIPKNAFDLVCWSDLAVTAVRAKAKSSRTVPRQYKNCLGCEKRFLAKRANNTTCSPRCQRRAHRKALPTVAVSEIAVLTPAKPAPVLAI